MDESLAFALLIWGQRGQGLLQPSPTWSWAAIYGHNADRKCTRACGTTTPAPQHPTPVATLYPRLVRCPSPPWQHGGRSVVRFWLVLDRRRKLGEGSASGMPGDDLGKGDLGRLEGESPASLMR